MGKEYGLAEWVAQKVRLVALVMVYFLRDLNGSVGCTEGGTVHPRPTQRQVSGAMARATYSALTLTLLYCVVTPYLRLRHPLTKTMPPPSLRRDAPYLAQNQGPCSEEGHRSDSDHLDTQLHPAHATTYPQLAIEQLFYLVNLQV